MAAGEGVCPFPLPPSQYYTLFTDENVAQGNVPKPPPPIEGSYTMFGATFEVFGLGDCCVIALTDISRLMTGVLNFSSIISIFLPYFQSDDSIIQPLEAQGITRLYPQHRRLGIDS